jgi:hypothetical protein
MSFDEHLRDELRRVTRSQTLDTDAALDVVKGTPLARLEDEARPRARRVHTQRLIGVAAAIAIVVGAIALPLALRNDGNDTKHDATHRTSSHQLRVDPKALAAVTSALDATTNVGSFRVAFTITEHPPTEPPTSVACPNEIRTEDGVAQPLCRDTGPHSVTTTGWATVNVDPYAIISVSNVSNFGDVTVRADDTRVWEQGGANYGLGSNRVQSPGQPLSGFASLVEGTLGRREGAGAMMGLASPYGYLHVVQDAITGAETIGTDTVNGEPVTVYRVSVEPERLASVPGLSDEQHQTIEAALAVLKQEGLTGNTTDVSVDARGFVVRTLSTNNFADGGSVVGDNTLSAFGCAGAIQMPNRPVTSPTRPATCADGTHPPPPLPTTTNADTITVPNVIGMQISRARMVLDGAALQASIGHQPSPLPTDDGRVVYEDPGPGTQVAPHSTVALIVAEYTPSSTPAQP